MTEAFRVAEKAAAARPKKKRRPRQAVTQTTLDPRVLVVARRLARGDMRRVQILGPTEALVTNTRAPASTTRRSKRAQQN